MLCEAQGCIVEEGSWLMAHGFKELKDKQMNR